MSLPTVHTHIDRPIWGVTVLIDPEFDELGGELTFAQIADPVPNPDSDEPYNYRQTRLRCAIRARERYEQQREQRHKEYEKKRAEHYLAQQTREHVLRWCKYWRVIDVQQQLDITEVKCRCCIPCNGRHTPNYWGTGQPDCW
jgi:hypothetical protein